MSLPLLVSKDRWQEFDDAWQELRKEGGPVDELVVAIRLAGDRKRTARLVPFAREHAAELREAGRAADAARVLGATLVAGGNPGELQNELIEAVQEAFGEEPWFAGFQEASGLHAGAPELRKPWKVFAKLIAMTPGSAVFHGGGWGAGEVLELDPAEGTIRVRFWNGREDAFPYNAAADIFDPLPETDLRVRHLRDPDGLRKQVKKDPLDALQAVVRRHNGKATTTQIKNALMQIGIEGSAWSAWWRKARKLAENSEWFEVAGTPQKSVVTMLLSAKDPADALRRTLERTTDLAEMHARVRDLFLGGDTDDALVDVALDVLAEAVRSEDEPLEERVAAWLLLREHRGTTPPEMIEALHPVVGAEPPSDPAKPPALWALAQELPGSKDQERLALALPEILGEGWIEIALEHLQHAAPGQVRTLVDAIGGEGRAKDLRAHYIGLLARPLRNPTLLTTLAERFEDASEADDMPTPVQRAQALLSLAHHLYAVRRGNPHLTRVSARLTELLAGGEDPLMRRLLADADVPSLKSVNVGVARGVDAEIDSIVTEVSLAADRHFFAHDGGHFWEGETIWTTKAGLERRSGELRELREVKIPENQDAIGRAAAFGDLSENSEWEAAMEEQRTLTARAMEIEEELRNTDLIEEAPLADGVVSPGTRVTYRETASGNATTVLLLGPWDEDEVLDTQVVSYRAPLAQGLLGRRAGDRVSVQLPAGEIEVEIVDVDAPDLSAIERPTSATG